MAQIAFEGRLTADAEIKYASSGKPYAKFTVAENFRELDKQSNEWRDSGVTFHNVTLFGRQAETAPLTKGTVVTVAGTQKSRAYTSQQGEERQWTETTTNTVGIVPVPQRAQSAPSPQGEQWNRQAAPQGGYGQPQSDPWAGNAPQGGYSDPAPF